MSKGNAVATTEDTAMPVAMFTGMEENAGAGTENVTTDDLAIPFLRVVQSGSPQLKKTKAEYDENAREGMLVNTVTGDLWNADDGVTVVPVAYDFKIIEWVPADQGGGFVAAYKRGDPNIPASTKNDKGKMITAAGHELVDTAEHYVLIDHGNGSCEPAIITMSSTQLKKSKKWNAIIGGKKLQGAKGPFQAPSYAFRYNLTTVPESNDYGDWAGFVISDAGALNKDDVYIYEAAVEFNKSVSKGEANVKYDEPTSEESSSQGTGDGGGSSEEAPF